MEVNKARSVELMAQRRVPVAIVQHLTKHFVADVKYRNMAAEELQDNPPEIFKDNGVSMHLNETVIDIDVDGPSEWQNVVAMAMKRFIGPSAFEYAFKRESLSNPTHYLFASDVAENIMRLKQVKNSFAVKRYQPFDGQHDNVVAMEFRTAIGEASNTSVHTVLPGSVYPRKDDPDHEEMLVWTKKTNDIRINDCPQSNTMRRVLYASLVTYLFGRFIDETMVLSDEKMGRHSFYLTLFGWMRRLYNAYPDEVCFSNEAELKEYCLSLVEMMCEYSEDEELKDRVIVVHSTFKGELEKLPGNPAFIETFRSMFTNIPRLMSDMSVLLGAPPRPQELEILFSSVAMDVSIYTDLAFTQLAPSGAWNQPDWVIRKMTKAMLEARYNSYTMRIGDKRIPITKIFQVSPEMKVIERRRFSRSLPPAEMRLLEVDTVSKRQLVQLNTFTGHPFEEDYAKYDNKHHAIKWFENTAKLLTQTEDEAKWLISRIASVFKDYNAHLRTMPVLIGEENTGKSKFIDTIGVLIGEPYTHQLGTKDLNQADSFTGFLEDKIFINATEIDLSEVTIQDRLKNWSADRQINVQGKGIEAHTIENPIKLIMLATNKDELQALNRHGTSADTRLALFRARSKHECEELRTETIGLFNKLEATMSKADEGKPAAALDAFNNMSTYLHKLDTPLMQGVYDLKTISEPIETMDRERLRVTQVPPEYETVIQIINEPLLINMAVGSRISGDILANGNTLSGCMWIERYKFMSAFNKMHAANRRKAERFINFFNSPTGKFGYVCRELCESYSVAEITAAAYKKVAIDGKKVPVVKIPPYKFIAEFMVDRYGELVMDKFPYIDNCDEDGYLIEEISEAEVMASLGGDSVGAF